MTMRIALKKTLPLFIFALSGCLSSQPQTPPTAGAELQWGYADQLTETDLNQIVSWVTGDFSTERYAAQNPGQLHINTHIVPIWPHRTDGRWVYSEHTAKEFGELPFRQTVYRIFLPQEKNIIRTEVYYFTNDKVKAANRGAWKEANALQSLSPEKDFVRKPCDFVYRKTLPDNLFEGHTVGRSCESKIRGATHVIVKERLYPTGYTGWEMGFDDSSKQLFGPPEAGIPYRYEKKKAVKSEPMIPTPSSASMANYPRLPLEKPVVVLKVIQSRAKKGSQGSKPEDTLKENLAHMISLVKKACTEGEKPDIVLFPEFPLSGLTVGKLADRERFAIEIPGPESKALGDVAKSFNTYVIFGSYAKDANFPKHILSLSTVIGRDGRVKKSFWKTRNVKRYFSSYEITTTTIESVRDKYRKLYGMDEEIPVLQTEFGNIAVSPVQLDPLVFSAFAIKGAEIILRTSTYFVRPDVIATAQYNNVYSAMANSPASSDDWPYGFPMEVTGGGSMVVAPSGAVLGELGERDEGILTAKIPIAEHRAKRTIPHFAWDVVSPVLSSYEQEIPTNYLDVSPSAIPENGAEMKRYFDTISRWKQK